MILLHATSGQPLTTADLSSYQAKLKSLADVGAVSPPKLSADKATAAYTVTLSLDPASTAAVRAVNHDYALVFPVAAAIILVMHGLMLRRLVAPWYLMASAGLGFGAALGATVLFFQDLRGQSGLVFLLPVYIYVFVVATFFTPSLTALAGRLAWWPGDSGPPTGEKTGPPARPEPSGLASAEDRRR